MAKKAEAKTVDKPVDENSETLAAPNDVSAETDPTPVTSTTALVPAPPVSIEDPAKKEMREAGKRLAARLPDSLSTVRDDITMNPRPTPSELLRTVEKLPEAEQEKMLEIVRKANPKKQGAHSAKASFAPTTVVLYHGTGKDELRPKNTIPGQFYTKEAQILGESFTGCVIGFYEGRMMWPQRPPGGGMPEGGTAPLCISYDRKNGSRYGPCASCPNANVQANQGGCTQEVTVFFMDRELTGIYELKFAKTSQKNGEGLIKILYGSKSIWDRWVTFESQERTKDANRWFVIKAGPVMDTKNPENNKTPVSLHPLFSQLSRIIDHDVYYTGLADTYDRSANSPDANNGATGSAGETVNMAALTGPAGVDDNPDYSTTKDA